MADGRTGGNYKPRDRWIHNFPTDLTHMSTQLVPPEAARDFTDLKSEAYRVAPRRTVNCYEFWDRVFNQAGLMDYTEGYYKGDPTVPYEEAQQNQAEFLLDEVECQEGSRILDIACGNGRLLEAVRRRGGVGVGVTISPEQVSRCRQKGLDVRLLNYRAIGPEMHGCFDGVVINGGIEHFVQPQDVVAGRADEIYTEMFEICHRAIDPSSSVRKFTNTTIHFDKVNAGAEDLLRNPWLSPWFSDKYHCAWLYRGFGGWYPSLGQLERCARGFKLIREKDATYDYYLTSEEWLKRGRRSLLTLGQWRRFVPFIVRHPLHAFTMTFMLLGSQSWNWQFRGDNPPMKHLWQTWQYQD